MTIDTAAISRLNKIVLEARKAIEIVRAGKSPATHFERIKEIAEGFPS